LRGTPGTWVDVVGDLLHQDGENEETEEGTVYVYRVSADFIRVLAAVETKKVSAVAKEWHQHAEHMVDWDAETVRETLAEAVGVAKKAEQAGKPVLKRAVT